MGKVGSGNGGKVGIVGMFFVFVFFFGDCFLGIIEEFCFLFEFLFLFSCRNLWFGLNENLIMCKFDVNE